MTEEELVLAAMNDNRCTKCGHGIYAHVNRIVRWHDRRGTCAIRECTCEAIWPGTDSIGILPSEERFGVTRE